MTADTFAPTFAPTAEPVECGACQTEVYLEPNVAWVDARSGDDGGTYDRCPVARHNIGHWPVERQQTPASVPTLNVGDVVHELGLRVLIDRKPSTYIDGDGYRVYSFRGLVTNLDELSPGRRMFILDDRYTVHGNFRATVQVQRRLAVDPGLGR